MLSIFLTVIACGAGPTAVPATLTIVPSLTPPATQTPPPLYLTVKITSIPQNETNDNPIYTVKAQIPNLQGSDDPRVVLFNNEMTGLTQEEIAKFRDNARMVLSIPGTTGSSYDQSYTLLSPMGNILSLKFDIYTYIQGAAHPTTHSRVFNYDLEGGRQIMMDQLFLPNSNYLNILADYCTAELKNRNIGFDSTSMGAQPTPENYGNWNITPEGLLITFDEYHVAAYAAGPQLITIPYSQIKTIIDPNGPLAPQAH